MFFQIAFKNILRNKRRTLLAEVSIIFGIVVIVFTGALTNGMSWGWATSQIAEKVGAMQIEHRDYEKEHLFKPLETTLTGSSQLIEEIKEYPGVTAAFGTLELDGMISNGSKATTFFGKGIQVSAMKETLPKMERSISKGRPLGESQEEILLGPKLAEDLELELGDTVMVLVQTMKGGLNMSEMIFVGTQRGGDSDYESAHYVEMHLSAAQRLMRMPERVSQIVIGFENFETIKENADRLQELLNTNNSVPLRVKDYTETIPGWEFNGFISLIGIVVGIVLFIVVGSGIANTMFMSVMERRKEIGTIKAIGAEQKHIKRLFILEGFIISLVGAIAGFILAVFIVIAVDKMGGVSFPPPPGSSIPITVPTKLDNGISIFAIALSLVVGILASYLPAGISARLDPVVTLREE
ncbi:FtsX-like permease family protein [bacterium]|nr:FtsX-like permease family protein [bacterium]